MPNGYYQFEYLLLDFKNCDAYFYRIIWSIVHRGNMWFTIYLDDINNYRDNLEKI